MHCAATVLLLREQPTGLEVLMMRRGSTLSFMAGMWVFPGGRMESHDESAAALARLYETQNKPELARNLLEEVERGSPYSSIGSVAGRCSSPPT